MGAITSQITSLTIVYSTVYSSAAQRKHQSPASLAFVCVCGGGGGGGGGGGWPVNSPHKWPVTRKIFPFDDVIIIYVIVNFQITFPESEFTWPDMAYNDGPTRKAPRLYISDPEGIKLVDFGASLNTVTGYVEQDGRIRHFVTNVTSGGPAEQFGMKSV